MINQKAILQLKAIKKNFGKEVILDLPKWQITEGIYWIQGVNGSGKSTLFRIVAGILSFEGTIVLDESIDSRRNPVDYRLKVNFSEAEPVFPTYLKVSDLLRFVAHSKKSVGTQLEELVKHFGVDSYFNQTIGACSSGMVKKVSLVMAFLGDPRLIILDEPLTTIDQVSQDNLMYLIAEYRRNGVTFLISSHQLFDAKNLSHTAIYLLKDKKLTLV